MEGKKFDKQPPLCCTKDSILDEERLECVDANNNIVEPDKTESQAWLDTYLCKKENLYLNQEH